MKALCLASLVLVLGACGAGDDVAGGARANCAQGGELTDCPDAERTPEAACWRLVDCGAIAIDHPEEFRFDWGNCVDYIETRTADHQRLIVNCIAASTCDQLRVDGSPETPNTDQMYCIAFGEP